MRKQVDDAKAAPPDSHAIQDRGHHAAAQLLSVAASEKLDDTGWDMKCKEYERFVGGFLGMAEKTLRSEIARLRAMGVLTPKGAQLVRNLYDGAKEEGRAGTAEG